MRTIAGEIVLPDDTPPAASGRVLIELRDVSVADAPSSVLASTTKKAKLAAGQRIKFTLKAPEASGRRLTLRVAIAAGGASRSRSAASSSYLTTQSINVRAEGDVKDLLVPVQKS